MLKATEKSPVPRFGVHDYDVKVRSDSVVVSGARGSALDYVEVNEGKCYVVVKQSKMRKCDEEIHNLPILVNAFDSLDDCYKDPFLSQDVRDEVSFIQKCILPRYTAKRRY